jgi:hypothetical protein
MRDKQDKYILKYKLQTGKHKKIEINNKYKIYKII